MRVGEASLGKSRVNRNSICKSEICLGIFSVDNKFSNRYMLWFSRFLISAKNVFNNILSLKVWNNVPTILSLSICTTFWSNNFHKFKELVIMSTEKKTLHTTKRYIDK